MGAAANPVGTAVASGEGLVASKAAEKTVKALGSNEKSQALARAARFWFSTLSETALGMRAEAVGGQDAKGAGISMLGGKVKAAGAAAAGRGCASGQHRL